MSSLQVSRYGSWLVDGGGTAWGPEQDEHFLRWYWINRCYWGPDSLLLFSVVIFLSFSGPNCKIVQTDPRSVWELSAAALRHTCSSRTEAPLQQQDSDPTDLQSSEMRCQNEPHYSYRSWKWAACSQ